MLSSGSVSREQLLRKSICCLNYFIITSPELNGCGCWIYDSQKLSASAWILLLNLNVNITYTLFEKKKIHLIISRSDLKSIYSLSFHTLANVKHLSSLHVRSIMATIDELRGKRKNEWSKTPPE